MQDKSIRLRLDREDLIFETGKIAKQANGSVTIQYGGTVVLVTACISKEPREDIDFFPLTVEYQEKTYAAGRIPGGFFKREGRPSESEILTARLIDRPIRPLFPKGLLNDVQIMAIVLSSDGLNDPDVLAVCGASASLSISDIPFDGPLGCCRVGRCNGKFILNPTYEELEKSDLDVIVAATKNGIIMLESKAYEISEEIYREAVDFGFNKATEIIKIQQEFMKLYAKQKLSDVTINKIDQNLLVEVKEASLSRLKEICLLSKKEEREESIDLLSKDLESKFTSDGFSAVDIKAALVNVEQQVVRRHTLDSGVRIDGRGLRDIRPVACEVAVLPRTHGSSLFTRGQTQSLAVTTLGTGEDQQLIEALEGQTYKSFMLHYSFPPFSVGETKPVRGPGRREIGHGALAEKAISIVMPKEEEFPYTIRVVSEILESNGSSSMATVCAAILALMDAGVPIKKPVAGIALGLIKEDNNSLILTDIAGLEDHFGDMDFKVAGTREGITAVQLDLKIDGIDLNILKACLDQAKEARLFILDKMKEAIQSPRKEISQLAPRIEILKVNPEKIGELIGPGGKTIKKIIAATGVTIDIQDDGSVLIASTDSSASQKAIEMVRELTEEVEVGKVYAGKIKRIMNFGAFCEIPGGKEGLIHISELSDHFVKNVEDVVKVGDEVKVKVIEIDELKRINLSIKQVPPETDSQK